MRIENPYEAAGRVLLRESGCTVRKWRADATGTAYTSAEDWGIAVPHPRGPISFGVFCHEVAHQLLHRRNSAPRWVEEVEAEQWALDQFLRFDVRGYEAYKARAVKHLSYTFYKATRRGVAPDTISARYPVWWALAEPRWTEFKEARG